MATLIAASVANLTIPELIGIPSKRKSLGQLNGILDRQIEVNRQECAFADPHGDGSDAHCNKPMLEILEMGRFNLEVAYKKWSIRLDELLEEDSAEPNLTEYKAKWTDITTKYTSALNLIIQTVTNIKKPALQQVQDNIGERAQNKIVKPISELRPFSLEKTSSPSRFSDWKTRFKSFFLASNLQYASNLVQQSYFRQSISVQLSNLLDSQISDDMGVYPDEDIQDDISCMSLLQTLMESRHPLALRRLALFSTKQGQSQNFSDYVAAVKKKAEAADTANFDSDSILSYILLSGSNDQEILEEILKLDRNPSFDQIVKIGTNLEISRSILNALPSANMSGTQQNRSFKIVDKKGYSSFKKTGGHILPAPDSGGHFLPSKHNKKTENPKNEFFKMCKIKKICTKCGSKLYDENKPHKCPVRSDSVCFLCAKVGHFSRICLNAYLKNEIDLKDYDSDSETESESETDSNDESSLDRSSRKIKDDNSESSTESETSQEEENYRNHQ